MLGLVARRKELLEKLKKACEKAGGAGLDTSNGFMANARAAVRNAISDMKRKHIVDRSFFKENLRILLKRFVQKEIGTKPVIVMTIVEV